METKSFISLCNLKSAVVGILSCAECLAILHKHKDVFQSLHVNCDFLVRKMRAPMKRLADTKTELANLNQS